ncbi:hypothetical protein EMIHUDRAFT_209643 [Emiliania huxleyi CCMP1516]|uniref:PARP catalytic domain-containing protein n=2 Tax=Emiliania huxleyi TaxID=2903 RepID=A0A0D3J2H9_EMIH1|nr:hypothetical protein EMIHUDRAFT_209643 [Emiliania huxleyi CCMP1516]EOD17714.1 hypothetical protein EMIHUDRAFT_209643 [Emiliania huxleyi CCMP1516]|eukprot:XP_005770143.1 hypothetical protein EMIHUDRAFT_209643 [Emiliania huxleyi CCMP1516]
MAYRIGEHSYTVSVRHGSLEQRNQQYGTVRRLRKSRRLPLSIIIMAVVMAIAACAAERHVGAWLAVVVRLTWEWAPLVLKWLGEALLWLVVAICWLAAAVLRHAGQLSAAALKHAGSLSAVAATAVSHAWAWAPPVMTWINLKRQDVCGDDSCWVKAILACLDLLRAGVMSLHQGCVVWTPSCPMLTTAAVVFLVGVLCHRVLGLIRDVMLGAQLPWASMTMSGTIMYHGTTASRARSIVSNGFRPSSSGMLGPGVYASRDIRKARQYGDGTMLTLRVSIGNVRVIRRGSERGGQWQSTSSWRGKYDSAWVKPGVQPSGEEHCIRDPRRIAIVGVRHSS